jgi:hypothetical protein
MLHWYRLAEHTLRSHRSSHAADSALVAHGRGSLTSSLSRREREKLFWLGLIESVPLLTGGAFSIYADSVIQIGVAAVLGIVATIVVCWFLRHHVPLTRIEFASHKDNRHDIPLKLRMRSNKALQPTPKAFASRRAGRCESPTDF